jgi:hypothetical protein
MVVALGGSELRIKALRWSAFAGVHGAGAPKLDLPIFEWRQTAFPGVVAVHDGGLLTGGGPRVEARQDGGLVGRLRPRRSHVLR